jgi:ferritin-like metal-binding protein YciE
MQARACMRFIASETTLPNRKSQAFLATHDKCPEPTLDEQEKQESPMTIATLDDLFHHLLKDVLFAERKVLRALPGMVRNATGAGLKTALEAYRDETEEHVIRLETIFDLISRPARGARCNAMVGLGDLTEGLIADIDDSATMDAALLSLARSVTHYEIARYGTLASWAAEMGKPDVAGLLKTTLDEEHAADKAFSRMDDQRRKASEAA